MASIDLIKEHADTIAVIVGVSDRNKVKEGKDLFNAAYFLFDKEIIHIAHKTLLPTHDDLMSTVILSPLMNGT
jgi:NAD+ synthase (glutamine-hydrolysing)